MSDQADQNPNWVKRKLVVSVFLIIGFVSVAAFLFSPLQSEAPAMETAQIDQDYSDQGYVIASPEETFEELVLSIEPLWLDPEYPFQDSTCFVSELGIPLIWHPHWPGSQQDPDIDFYGGAFLHDLFYRANCP